MNNAAHIPVMTDEVIDALQIEAGQWYVDATFGRGGHASRILENGGRVVGFDFDQRAIDQARRNFSEPLEEKSLVLIHENFDKLAEKIDSLQKQQLIDDQIQGILFDFGTSTDQLMDEERGLSFENPTAKLDMRLDDRLGVEASGLLKVMSLDQLTKIFSEFGGEGKARNIAKSVIKLREKDPTQLETVGGLVKIVARHKPQRTSKLHPATKVFQALRIAVNDELNNIERALPQALEIIPPKGRIVTIAFHEGEDRLAKQFFVSWEKEGKGVRITQKPIKPSTDEIKKNPRSRSAKLRIFEKGKE